MLTKAHIKNFKSLRDVTLTFGRNNVLVGPNMSGKSNVVDFFRFVRDMLVPSQGIPGIANAINPRTGFTSGARLDLIWKGTEEPLISFELEGQLHDKENESTWRYDVVLFGNFQWGSVGVQEETLTFTDNSKTVTVIETKDQRRKIYDRKGSLITDLLDPNRLALEHEYPNSDGFLLKRSCASWKFYDLVPSRMRNPNPSAAPDSLSASGDNLSSWLMFLQTRYSEAFSSIRSVVRDVLPDISGIFTNPTSQSTVYLASDEAHLSRPITVAEMSAGQLALIALLSLLYTPPALKGDVCFIEEPENHLHPRMLNILTDLLSQVQLENSSSRGQLFLTTHSPYLLDKFSIDELLLFSKKNGATYVTRPGDKTELKNLITDEEIGLGDLFYSGALSDA